MSKQIKSMISVQNEMVIEKNHSAQFKVERVWL
jgi:hypothetical protein